LPLRGRQLLGATEDKLTPGEDVTGYNNYYEFGTGKDDPARATPAPSHQAVEVRSRER